MAVKIFSAAVAMALVLAFLLPPVVKLKDVPLGLTILLGLVMMAVDLWQSLRKED